MTPEAAVFWIFAGVTVISAAVVVLARSLIYSAFALLFTFFGVAGLYLLLGADFLAATQLMIYVGGILVLLLFGVMLTHRIYDLRLRTEASQVTAGAFIAAGVFVVVSAIAVQTDWPQPFLQRLQVDHALLIPIVVLGNPIGLFLLGRESAAPFAQQEVTWIEAISENVAMAFERGRLMAATPPSAPANPGRTAS